MSAYSPRLFSSSAMEFVPQASNIRLLDYLKSGSNLLDSNISSPFLLGPKLDSVHTNAGLEPRAKIEGSAFQEFSGFTLKSKLLMNGIENNSKKTNLNSNYSFLPRDFSSKMFVFNATSTNSIGMNLNLNTSQVNSSLDEFDEFKNLESDLEAILKDVELDECVSGIQECSLNSKTSSTLNNPIKSRLIVGRGVGYYQRYGTKCIEIPKNDIPLHYPPSRRIESLFVASTTGGVSGDSETIPRMERIPRRRHGKNTRMECSFCKNIASTDSSIDYKTHWLKNNQNLITCPVLRAYTCPLCYNEGGDFAHTIRYCPLKRQKLAEDFQRTKIKSLATQQSRANRRW